MRFALILAALLPILPCSSAYAQLSTATGRQITMSNSAWKIFIPSTYQHRIGDATDLLVHFHGDPQTYWNNAKYANLNAVVLTVNYNGFSSAYQTPFSNALLFQSILDEAQTTVRAQADFADNMVWDKIALSSFSAGYAAVREIFKNSTHRANIDAYLAADSIHAGTAPPPDGTPVNSQLVDFTTMAALAKSGSKTFILTHSQIPTPDYESTTEVANEILQNLALSAPAVNSTGLGTLVFNRHVKSGSFELWGATGSDAPAHSKHLQYIGEFLEDLPLAKLTDYAADFNNDGTVDATDLTTWRGAFGAGATGDTDADGDTDGRDFLKWQSQRGLQPAGVSAATAVPEPTAAAIAATLALLLLARAIPQ